MSSITTNVANTTLHSSFSKCLIHPPAPSQIEKLRQLWKDTFGDTDTFLDIFFKTAFSYERCLCVTIDDSVVAALYWFDCEFSTQKIAYIYAVATAKEYRGQGICHVLMEHTHLHLKEKGYAGAMLSPAEESLFDFYKKMGYETTAYIKEIHCDSSLDSQPRDMELKAASYDAPVFCNDSNVELREISKTEFAKLRRYFLPETAVLQENENLDFLEQQVSFYAGKNFLLTAQVTDIDEQDASMPTKHLHGIEFLGNPSIIPSIVHAFSCATGTFRTIGTEKPLGMYYAFTDTNLKPNYLGFIFD